MKTFLAIIALVSFQGAIAQKRIELKDFKRITVASDIKLDMVKGTENKIVYNGQETLEVKSNGEDLTFEGEGSATLYYKSELESITVGSDAEVSGNEEIKGKPFQLTAGSDSKVSLVLNVDELRVTAGSDAKVSLTGKANMMKATVGSDGKFSTQDLSVGDVTINLGSDAHGTIKAKGVVNATVASDAALTIYGNPSKVNETKSSDAKITVVR